ncbi:MAG: sensor histidine kinase N-terminal domain-containing protein [Planctomycetes bacterium]|nr:sensor histidine kinase N-terminal domain-containing protein [Planctomycetota bacterium]
MKSIRRSLLVSILSGIVVSGLVCGGVLYQRMKGTLVSQFDSVLAAKVRALASMLDVDDGWLEFNYAADLMPEFEGGSDPEYFQISFADGRLLRKSATLGAAELPLCYGNVGAAELFDLVLPDGRAGRAIGVIAPVDLESDDDAPVTREEAAGERFDVHVVLVAARARAELDGALGALRDALWLAGTVLALLAGAVVLAGVRRGLRPLAALGQEVASIEAGSLSRRVSRRGLPLELDGMAAKLNELLARLEQAFQRERRVTGNIAHELRGPIAELRSARSKPRTPSRCTWAA